MFIISSTFEIEFKTYKMAMAIFSFVCKADFLQRMLVNLDIDDFITETIGSSRAHSLLVEMERTENSYVSYSAQIVVKLKKKHCPLLFTRRS